jgi:hypothetical protein
MRIITYSLFLLIAALGSAAFGGAHAVKVTGAVSFQDPFSATSTVKTKPYTNAKILSDVLLVSGTSGAGLKTSDLDIAMDDTTYEMDVIVKSTQKVFFTLAQTGTSPKIFGPIEQAGLKTDMQSHIQSSYLLKVLAGEVAVCGLRANVTLSGADVVAINGSFMGGTESTEAVQGQLIGGFKTTKKTYTVVP